MHGPIHIKNTVQRSIYPYHDIKKKHPHGQVLPSE